MPGGPRRETEVHTRLAEYRQHGEWFTKAPEVMAVVALADQLYGQEFYNQVAARRGAALQAFLDRLQRGEVTRAGRGPSRHPKTPMDRYAWTPSDPFRKVP